MAPTLEERVAYLEGKVEEHSKAWQDLKDLIINLDSKVDRFREGLSSRVDALDREEPPHQAPEQYPGDS